MKQTERATYPDISPIIAQKEKRRRELAALSWEEKVAIIDRMRKLQPEKQWKERCKSDAVNYEGKASSESLEVSKASSTGNADR